MFLTYVIIKVNKTEVLRPCFKHVHMLLLFSVFPGKLPHSHYLTPWNRPFHMFLRYVIKVDKRKVVPRLYFKYSCVLLLFPGFYAVKVNKLDSYNFFDPPPGSGQIDRFQANFISVICQKSHQS